MLKEKYLILKQKLFKDITLEKANFNFFADKTDILLKNIFGETGHITVKEGDLKINLSSGIFTSQILSLY